MNHDAHDFAWREWREAVRNDRMHHAWMLTGRKGLGKRDFALAAAGELITDSASHSDMANHPDILVLDRHPKDDKEERKRADGKPFETKRNIPVSQIRAMQQRLTTRPTMGNKRAVIIDPADVMEPAASNALLKSLEEPPQGTYFILIAHSPAKLLPTIRSRCRTLRFPTLSHDQMLVLLGKERPEAAIADREAAAATGSPGTAIDFLDRELGKIYTSMQAIVKTRDADHTHRSKLTLAIGSRPDRDRMLAVLNLARRVLANEVGNVHPSAFPKFVDAHSEMVKLTAQMPVYNFDTALLIAEIGTLLASAAPSTANAHV
ncbi:MAG: DNA polymerase III subunit delta' [Pontixanthobacter sp.]